MTAGLGLWAPAARELREALDAGDVRYQLWLGASDSDMVLLEQLRPGGRPMAGHVVAAIKQTHRVLGADVTRCEVNYLHGTQMYEIEVEFERVPWHTAQCTLAMSVAQAVGYWWRETETETDG